VSWGWLSVPYLGSNCLEPIRELTYAECIRSFSTLPRVELPGADIRQAYRRLAKVLSVPYLGSNCLERRIGGMSSCLGIFSFSTLPRVELPGALLATERANCSLAFQYPTSGRTAWSSPLSEGSPHKPALSVPYLGSNCLELNDVDWEVWSRWFFQYPTSGRTAWSILASTSSTLIAVFQYPTSGRTAWSCRPILKSQIVIDAFSTLPRVELPGATSMVSKSVAVVALSVPYLGSNCLEHCSRNTVWFKLPTFSTLPRVELPGAMM